MAHAEGFGLLERPPSKEFVLAMLGAFKPKDKGASEADSGS
jgi:hypothetical protein